MKLTDLIEERNAELDKDNLKSGDPHCNLFRAVTKCMVAVLPEEIEEARNMLWQAIKERESESMTLAYEAGQRAERAFHVDKMVEISKILGSYLHHKPETAAEKLSEINKVTGQWASQLQALNPPTTEDLSAPEVISK